VRHTNRSASRLALALPLVVAVLAGSIPGRALAESGRSTDLELASLAENARARHASLQVDLASIDTRLQQPGGAGNASLLSERARVAGLLDRNARVLEGYGSRLSAGGSGPAAPDSSGGGGGGIMSKITGLFGGGGASGAGPVAESWGGSGSGASPTTDLKGYLKENWPGLVGATVGSIAGGIIGKRLMGGSWVGGIVGSMVGGWIGQKAGDFIGKKFRERSGRGEPAPGGSYAANGRDPVQVYGGPLGQPTGQVPPAAYQAPALPAAQSLAEARELMQARYQVFLASTGGKNDPSAQAGAYRSYMAAKAQYESMQGR
jgi:hypothetical protein